MLQNFTVNLGFLRRNKYAETLMQAVSECFSRTTSLNIIFTCYLVMPVGKRYYGPVQRSGVLAASMEAMPRQGATTLARAFSYNVTQMISLFQDYLDNLHSFRPVKD
jgi:hypothetical protein